MEDPKGLFVKKIQSNANFSQNVFSKLLILGVLYAISKSQSHVCERNLSAMILIGNQMVFFVKLGNNFSCVLAKRA